MATTTTNYDSTSYLTFDAMSLRNLIIQRLNDQGNFTDQRYVGSNLASIIDIIAYAYNTLIYYLNKTSNESMFSEAQLYENINRIVKLIDYKPIGFQTSTLLFQASAVGFDPGLYTIPRYSYVFIENIPFSFNEDITFYVDSSTVTALKDISNQKVLFQGVFIEHPTIVATGGVNETFVINTPLDVNIDHFNVFVYVKEKTTNKWTVYNEIPNLFLSSANARVFERRLNENKRYELKFGDGIAGRKLEQGDEIAVYYLQSTEETTTVGPHAMLGVTRTVIYSTERYNQIISDINEKQFVYLDNDKLKSLQFDNSVGSTFPKPIESVDEIRQKAPGAFIGQYRLVTADDFERFINSHFSNFISDVKVANNWEYLSSYVKYFYEAGIASPSLESQSLINQIRYADACNFNNVYICAVPKTAKITTNKYLSYAQKEIILNALQTTKMLTTEVVFVDPIYKAVDFLAVDNNKEPTLADVATSALEIIRKPTNQRSDKSIVKDVANIIIDFFAHSNNKIGRKINLTDLHKKILEVDGVQSIKTVNIFNPDIYTNGLSLAVWNPNFPQYDFKKETTVIDPGPFGYLFWSQIPNLAIDKIYVKQSVYSPIEY